MEVRDSCFSYLAELLAGSARGQLLVAARGGVPDTQVATEVT